jgi:hypothetical protein
LFSVFPCFVLFVFGIPLVFVDTRRENRTAKKRHEATERNYNNFESFKAIQGKANQPAE